MSTPCCENSTRNSAGVNASPSQTNCSSAPHLSETSTSNAGSTSCVTNTASVAVIGRPFPFTVENVTAAAAATRRAIDRDAPVIYQAAMFDGRFVGFADFLVRRDGTYQVSDTKLARSAKVTALLQLAAYADTLSQSGIAVHPEAELVLGNGVAVNYRVDELVPVYREQRARLQRLLDNHYAGGSPVRWDDEQVRACFRCPVCEEQVRAADDLLLVAGMRVSQRAKLLDAGISTVAELARHVGPVANVSARSLSALVAQATLQIRERDTGAAQFEVADPQPLTLLPDPDEGDLFFDFEGDPLWTADGVDWGLEYLFGVLEGGKAGTFHPLWAHDRPDERKALTDFLALVAKRRKRFPNMHIYHYAAYEKTALLRLAGRHGVGEDEVDDLLRSGTLVDLYPIVRKSIRTGSESLSLKALEPLYMGSQLRTGDVTTATDSITQYARYSELRGNGQLDAAAAVLEEIEDYNQLRLPVHPRAARLAVDARLRKRRHTAWRPTGFRWRQHRGSRRARGGSWRSSPASRRALTALPSRRRSRWCRPHAATTVARTSRSGGRTSIG